MTNMSFAAIAEALSASLSRRLDLSDDRDMAVLVDQDLELRVMQTYREQLDGLEGPDAVAWILRRMATIEARVLMLAGAGLRDAPPPADDSLGPRAASVSFDADLVQTGFYPVEFDSQGSCFRWLGPDPRGSVFLPSLPGPVEIVIAVKSAFVPEVIDQVTLALDGGAPTVVQVERQGNHYLLSARLGRGATSHAGTMRLDIDAIRTETPVSRGKEDSRALALAIARIDVTCV